MFEVTAVPVFVTLLVMILAFFFDGFFDQRHVIQGEAPVAIAA